jgi:hypothetical protein
MRSRFLGTAIMRLRPAGLLTALLLLAAPALAENQLPSPLMQEVLIKTALLTLNDANLTGNYAVLHAKLAKPFRDQYSPERLKQVFKGFVDQKADWGVVAAKPPVPTAESTIDKRGALVLRGYFDTSPSRLSYELDFVPSEGEWKPVKLFVKVKPPNEG